MDSLFYPCTQTGCNRKYKTQRQWGKHMKEQHLVTGQLTIPFPIEFVKKTNNKRSPVDEVARSPVVQERGGQQCFNSQKEMLEIQKRVKEDTGECAICFDSPQNAVAIPCGHAYFCLSCLTNQFENHRSNGCPFCRGKLEKVVKIFQ